MHGRQPQGLRTADLLKVPRGVIGGLIVERAEPVRARSYQERWERDIDLWSAITDGLRAAADGEQPGDRVERLPAWVLTTVKDRLRDHEIYWLRNDFGVARILELVGLAHFDPDDDYVISMLTGLVSAQSWDDQTWNDPVAWFRQDPELIDRGYWRAYEIEGRGVRSLRVNDNHPGAANWREATRRMIDEGLISRSQVITACMEALDRDFSPAASQWFVRLLTDLELTDDELVGLQPTIRRHLDHRAAAVVRNAIGWMERLDRQRLLDDEATAPALEPAVLAPTKITAMAGLRLLDNIRIRTAFADVVPAARAGLGHRHTDVQRAAAKLLLAAGAAGQLAADADLLDPSVQREFGLQLVPDGSPVASNTADSTAGASSTASWRPVTRRDVADRLAALLERAEDPFELELVLDQLARTGKSDLLHPLAKRAHSVVTANEFHRLEQQLAALILASCGTTVSPAVPELPWARFLHRRLTEVRRILDGTAPPRSLLATPTEPSGWLDPVEFARRAQHADLTARHADIIAGLLRLAPDDRAGALELWRKAAPAVPPELDHVVRHALGGERRRNQAMADRSLWVAASRARSPLHDDLVLIEGGLGGAGQGRGLEPTVSVVANPRLGTGLFEHDHWDLHVSYRFACTSAAFSAARRDSWWTKSRPWDINQPTATGDLTSRSAWDSSWTDTAWLAWHGLIWPADAEHYANAVVIPTYVSRHWSSPDRTTIDILAGLRRHPGRIGPTAAATVALAMTGGTVETRIHTADTIVDLISRHRLTTDNLAAALVTTAPVAVPARWAHTLQHVAAAGHSEITIQLLTSVLPALPRDRNGLHALLDLLHQELLRTNGAVTDGRLRNSLAQLTGSSKAAKSARAILAL